MTANTNKLYLIAREHLQELYDLSLSDTTMAALCQWQTADIAQWRQDNGYPANEDELPYNPRTGKPFTSGEMREAIIKVLKGELAA